MFICNEGAFFKLIYDKVKTFFTLRNQFKLCNFAGNGIETQEIIYNFFHY